MEENRGRLNRHTYRTNIRDMLLVCWKYYLALLHSDSPIYVTSSSLATGLGIFVKHQLTNVNTSSSSSSSPLCRVIGTTTNISTYSSPSPSKDKGPNINSRPSISSYHDASDTTSTIYTSWTSSPSPLKRVAKRRHMLASQDKCVDTTTKRYCVRSSSFSNRSDTPTVDNPSVDSHSPPSSYGNDSYVKGSVKRVGIQNSKHRSTKRLRVISSSYSSDSDSDKSNTRYTVHFSSPSSSDSDSDSDSDNDKSNTRYTVHSSSSILFQHVLFGALFEINDETFLQLQQLHYFSLY